MYTVASPLPGSVTWCAIVESTAPCAIGFPCNCPSSASRHVPSAPWNPLVPVAYSSIRCSPQEKNVAIRYRLFR